MFQKFGLVEEYWKAAGSQEIDKGRFGVTQDPADLSVFKVPSLRNVAMTPPYFHDASVATLEDAVQVMGRVPLGAHCRTARSVTSWRPSARSSGRSRRVLPRRRRCLPRRSGVDRDCDGCARVANRTPCRTRHSGPRRMYTGYRPRVGSWRGCA